MHALVEDAVDVSLPLRAVTRVKVFSDLSAVAHAQVARDVSVDGRAQLIRLPRALQVRVRHLRLRVDARVRAPRAVNDDAPALQQTQRALKLSLHGSPAD